MRTGFLTVVLLGIAIAGVSAPRIEVDREIFDFGIVVDGTVLEFFVTITNTGNQLLTIRASYRCACTSVELPKQELNPGEAVKMKIRFNTAGYSQYVQPVVQTVTLSSNDPARPRVIITVRGTVRTLSAHEAPAKVLSDTFYLLIDLREPEKYAQGHLFGAFNIPLSELEGWIEKLPKDRVIYVYDETGEKSAQVITLLFRRKGFLLVRSIRGGLLGWWQELGDLFFIQPQGSAFTPQGKAYTGGFTVTPSQIAWSYQVIVDVRRAEEFKAGHIIGAINVPLFTHAELVAWAKTLPVLRPGYILNLWIVDEDGTRACTIAGWLREHGYPDTKCLFGGMKAWHTQFGSELVWTKE